MPTSHQAQAAQPDNSRQESISRNDLRQQILAMRQAKQEEMKLSADPASFLAVQSTDDRYSWFRVEEEGAPGSSAITMKDKDDNDSTVLYHNSSSQHHEPPSLKDPPQARASLASHLSYSSSATTSRNSMSQDDDLDTRSMQTLTTVDDSSDHACRRMSRSKDVLRRRSGGKNDRPGTACSVRSNASTRSRPLCPPPNLPLPPRPSTASSSHSASQSPDTSTMGGSRSPWRLSGLSAASLSADSLGTGSFSRGGSGPSRLSRRLSAGSDASDSSAAELSSIRRISAFFPPPCAPSPGRLPSKPRSRPGSNTDRGSRAGSEGRSSTRSPRRTSATGSKRSSNATFSPVVQSPVLSNFTSQEKESGRVDLSKETLVEGDDEDDLSDGALSEVLHMTTSHRGSLFISPKIGSACNGGVAQVGLKLASSSSTSLLMQPAQGSDENLSSSPSGLTASSSGHLSTEQPDEEERRRRSLIRKSLTGLVAALDEEAARWSLDSPSRRGSHSQGSRSSMGEEPAQRHVVNRAEETAFERSETPRSRSERSSLVGTQSLTDAADNSADLNSIYSKYRRNSVGTIATHDSRPTVRVENADGSSVSGSETELSSIEDDGPRKRTKKVRRKGFGFDDQRAAPFRNSSVRSFKPGEVFAHAMPAPLPAQQDPYAYYEFCPSLPPFVPNGLQPRDLTGTGTWSSIVARANSGVSRQPSISSIASLATTATTGPVSLREIAAGARVKRERAEAAKKARESQSSLFSSMSYKPFEIHRHAKQQARFDDSPPASMLSRNTTMSMLSVASSSMILLASRWPVAVGEDTHEQAVGTEVLPNRDSLVGLGIGSQTESSPSAPAKVYAEVCMQTSPSSTPSTSPKLLPAASIQTDAPELKGSSLPRRELVRRKTMAALSSTYSPDVEEGAWPAKIRAPRLSGRKSTIGLSKANLVSSASKFTIASASREDDDTEFPESSGDESDLDLSATLEVLAERSGVFDEARGSKRKQRRPDASFGSKSTPSQERQIATIPARARLSIIPAAHSRRQRLSTGSGWTSSEDESDDDVSVQRVASFRTPQPVAKSKPMPSFSLLAPSKAGNDRSSMLRKSASVSHLKHRSSRRGRFSIPDRAASPDLSVLTIQSDEEGDSLFNTELDLPSHIADIDILTTPPKRPAARSSLPEKSTPDSISKIESKMPPLSSASAAASRQANDERSSVGDVIEMIREADEFLSTGHSMDQHSSGHETISETCGTSGHDPQRKPNVVLAEIVLQRLALQLQNVATGSVGSTAHIDAAANREHLKEDAQAQSIEWVADETDSLHLEDIPSTMTGSDVWSTMRGSDRDSSASTATTWSQRSLPEEEYKAATIFEAAQPAAPVELADSEHLVSVPAPSAAAEEDQGATTPEALGTETKNVGQAPSVKTMPSALPTSSRIGRPIASTLGRKSGAAVVNTISETATGSEVRNVSPPLKANAAPTLASRKGQRPSLPVPVSALRQPSTPSRSISMATPHESRLRKIKSMGDELSKSFVALSAPALPKLPNGLTIAKSPISPMESPAKSKAPSSLPRKSSIPVPPSASPLAPPPKHVSKLPTPITPRAKAVSPRPSGIPRPSSRASRR